MNCLPNTEFGTILNYWFLKRVNFESCKPPPHFQSPCYKKVFFLSKENQQISSKSIHVLSNYRGTDKLCHAAELKKRPRFFWLIMWAQENSKTNTIWKRNTFMFTLISRVLKYVSADWLCVDISLDVLVYVPSQTLNQVQETWTPNKGGTNLPKQ